MNDIVKAIYQRRSVRKYKAKGVYKSVIEQIIDAGRMAPSAINHQPWKFYVLTDKELIKEFSKQIGRASIKGIAKMGLKTIVKSAKDFIHSPHDFSFFKDSDFVFHGAPVVVFITAPKKNEWATLDVGMCSQNMMLAAESFGLDSCPVGLAKFVEDAKVYSKLNVPKTDHVLLAIILGYGDEKPELKQRIKDNIYYIN